MSHSQPPRRARSGTAQKARRPIVLLTMAEEGQRALFGDYLRRSGFEVILAADAGEAVEAATALHMRLDAIALDLALPGIDGLKVARRLRFDELTTRIPIVALAEQPALASVALSAGCDAFVQKPCLPGTLLGELLRLLAKTSDDGGAQHGYGR